MGMTRRRLLAMGILIPFAYARPASSAGSVVCCGPSATGNGSGSDWNNQAAFGSVTLTRGYTYYLADGSYSGRTCSTGASGSTLITIKKAVVGDPAVEGIAGWSSTYGDGQATFTGQMTFSTSYWLFDGVKHGAVWSRTPSDYGFLFSPMSTCLTVVNNSSIVTNVTCAGITAVATSSVADKYFLFTSNTNPGVNAVTISHCLLDGWQNCYHATSSGKVMDGWVFEYNVCINGWGDSNHHGEYINNNGGVHTNQITRYNYFGSAINYTGCVVANNNSNQNPQVYGNVFDNYDSGNGVITGTSAGRMTGALVYNNTFANCGVSWIGDGNTTGTVAYNNLLYNMSAGYAGSATLAYNAYFSCTNVPSETGQQTGSGSPLVNYAGRDFHLAFATNNGTALPSPYNIDPDGRTRGSDGVWDRGAYEYGVGAGAGTRPGPPMNLRSTP